MIRLIMAIINNKILYVPFILPSIKAIKTRDETYAAKIDSKEEYYKLLGKVYAEDASYIEKLKRLEKYYQPLKKLKNNNNS